MNITITGASFSQVLLALVDAEYRFFLVDVGSSRYSSDAQILNHSNSRKKIEDGTPGGAPDLHYFLLGDDVFALMPWLAKPYSRRQITKEEIIANYRIS